MIFCLNVLNGGTNNSSALGKCCFNIPLPLENDLNPSKPVSYTHLTLPTSDLV